MPQRLLVRVEATPTSFSIPLRSIFIGGAGVLVLVVVFLTKNRDETNTGSAVGAKPTDPGMAGGPGSWGPNSPELRFASSGRLPVALQDFRLSMSVADAVSAASKGGQTYAGPTPSEPERNLWLHTADGFLVTCFFSKGRLVEAKSSAEDISPVDEAVFRRSAMDQLGKPDRELERGPDTNSWVWIDGDVRVRYTNRHQSDITGSRSAEVEVAVYPALLADDSAARAQIGGKEYLRHLRLGWGDDLGAVVRKPLPKGLQGDVSLRMKPWQVRSAVPGIQIISYSEKGARGALESKVADTTVDFWDGSVSKFCRTTYDIAPDQFSALHERLIKGLGEPTEVLPFVVPPAQGPGEIISWEDTQVEVWYGLGAAEPKGTAVSVCFTDKGLYRLASIAKWTGRRDFATAPKIRSFF